MWFTENAWPPIILSGIVGLVFFFKWNSDRDNKSFKITILCGALCVGFYFLERIIITDGEQLQVRVANLCEDFRLGNRDKTLSYVSDDKPGLKKLFEEAFTLFSIHSDLRLSDFQVKYENAERVKVHFRANATIDVKQHNHTGYYPARLILTFKKEKGEWKIDEIERLNPVNGQSMGVLQQSAA